MKGTMRLIDAETAEALYAAMGPAVEASSGSGTLETVRRQAARRFRERRRPAMAMTDRPTNIKAPPAGSGTGAAAGS